MIFRALHKAVLFICCLFVVLSLLGQNKLDSLSKIFQAASADSTRVRVLFDMGDVYKKNSPDSALHFYNKALSLAKKAKLDTTVYSKKRGSILRDIGLKFRQLSRYDEALAIQKRALELAKAMDDSLNVAQGYVYLGNIYFNIANFDHSLECYFNALKTFEKLNNKIGVADSHNNIGSVFKEMEEFDKALDHHRLSVDVFEGLLSVADSSSINRVKRNLSYCYNNIGVAHWHKGENDQAIDFYIKSLELKKEVDDKNGVAQGYNNIAIVYATENDFTKSIEFFQKSLEVYTSTQNLNGLAMVNGNIAYLNILLSNTNESSPKKKALLESALSFAIKSYSISKEIGALSLQIEAAGYLKLAYSGLGDYSKALEYANEYIKIQQEIFSKEKASAIAETTSRYEAEKKQLLIDNMEKEKLLFMRRIEIQQITIFFATILVLIFLISTILYVNFYRQKRKANVRLSEQNEEILQQKEEIITQLDEIETQNREIEQLYLIALERKNILEKQRDSINDSIRYAKFIQNAVLPDLKSIFKEAGLSDDSYFIMYRPKDVVSGDFYWATHTGDWLIVTVADCTGHGVPGSLMSMLGVSFLNEIVLKNKVYDPAQILEKLRSYVIEALKQSQPGETQRDGMEMSIVAINIKSRECLWAGANNPLWIIRREANPKIQPRDVAVEEYKPDFMPVAVHIVMSKYSNQSIQLNLGDKLYLFSDGYGDQFGGPEGKKFNMYSAFKRQIYQTSALPMNLQGIELESVFDSWINFGGSRVEQIDDITVLGIMV